jgi:sugar phosphate isomerase/epimerase
MRISIAGYSFHGLVAGGQMDVFGYLESCRYRYHLSTADLWCGLLGRDPDVYLQDAFIERVRRAIDERGLTLVNYHADGCHVWEDNAAVREKHLALAERHIAAAEKLGARTVRVDTGGRDRHWTAEQFDHIAAQYRAWAKRAADAGYRIGPETHWGADNYADNQLQLAEAIDNPAYGILLHMGKPLDLAPDDYDRALAPYAMHTHIDQKTTETRLASALQILIDAGYAGCLGVEHHSARNEYNEVAAQLGAVQRTLGQLLAGQVTGKSKNPILGF